jgi:hypothetical protein
MEREYLTITPGVPQGQSALAISDSLWATLVMVCQLIGFAMFATGVIALVQKSNSVRQFIGINDRTPTINGMRYVGDIALLVLGSFLLFAASHAQQYWRTWVRKVLFGLHQRWQNLGFPVRFLITCGILLYFVGLNMNQILAVPFRPFTYDDNWDLKAAVFRTEKEKQLNEMLNALKEGCLLCSFGPQPLENRTTGDDIGLFFFFGVAHKLALFPASLAGYQQFIATSFGLIILMCSVIVIMGFRSLVAGIIIVAIITVFDTTKYYESLLMTSYWVPAGASLFSVSMALGLLGRADHDEAKGLKPAYGFYYTFFGLWGLVAGWAYLGRSSAGLITLISALVLLVIMVIKMRTPFRWLPALGLFAGGFTILIITFQFTLTWRLTRYNLSPPIPNTMTSHAFSHAVLVGLGYVTNDEGLIWNDGIGAMLAEKECPRATYLGPEYYNCTRDIVLKIIINDPNLLIRNVLAKLESTIQITFSFLPGALFLLVALYLIRRPSYYLVLVAMLALKAVPALLTMPYPSYLQGYFQVIVISIAAGVILFNGRLNDYLESKAKYDELESPIENI